MIEFEDTLRSEREFMIYFAGKLAGMERAYNYSPEIYENYKEHCHKQERERAIQEWKGQKDE